MKLRTATLLMLVSLLVTGSLASAGDNGPLSKTADLEGVNVAPMTPTQGPQDCRAAALPAFEINPSPILKAGALCGSCSSAACRGVATGTNCNNSISYSCQVVFGKCSTGGWECDCVSMIP